MRCHGRIGGPPSAVRAEDRPTHPWSMVVDVLSPVNHVVLTPDPRKVKTNFAVSTCYVYLLSNLDCELRAVSVTTV